MMKLNTTTSSYKTLVYHTEALTKTLLQDKINRPCNFSFHYLPPLLLFPFLFSSYEAGSPFSLGAFSKADFIQNYSTSSDPRAECETQCSF
jgi:hypothetical protein